MRQMYQTIDVMTRVLHELSTKFVTFSFERLEEPITPPASDSLDEYFGRLAS